MSSRLERDRGARKLAGDHHRACGGRALRARFPAVYRIQGDEERRDGDLLDDEKHPNQLSRTALLDGVRFVSPGPAHTAHNP